MHDITWMALYGVGAALALLGITNMGKSAFVGWMMIAFAAAFGLAAWRLKKRIDKDK